MTSNVSARIRMARARAHLSQRELGDLVGYSEPTVGRWERGESTPRGPILDAIAEACGFNRVWFTEELGHMLIDGS